MRRVLILALVLLLVMPATHVLAQDNDPIRFEPTPELTVFRSKHYRIHTNLTRDETQPFGRHADEVFEQYNRRFRGLLPQRFEPMPLYLFRTEQQYDRFLAEHDIDATHSGGMFFVTHKVEGLATWAQAGNRRKTFEVIQHEGFHQFAWHAIGPGLPVWLNEGLAQYFEDAVLTDGRMTLGLTKRPRIDRVRQAIQDGEALPLSELMFITGDDWSRHLRRDPDHAALLYAQAWSVAYYLIHGEGGRNQPKLIEYLTRLSDGERSEDALVLSFGREGLTDLATDWRRYARTQRPDDVAEATERLEFLGTGLRLLAEQGEDMPGSIEELRETLQRYGFRLRRRELGVTRYLSAESDELFRFTHDGDESRAFVLLQPDRVGLPPRITAPGLSPEPTLIWYRDADDELVQDIAYE